MHTGLIIDFYDDPIGLVLKTKMAAGQVPGFIKTAQFLGEQQRESLPDDVYALVMIDQGEKFRKYACVDKGNTALSVIYFLENGDKLPEEAQKVAAANLLTACSWYDLQPPAPLMKVAGAKWNVAKKGFKAAGAKWNVAKKGFKEGWKGMGAEMKDEAKVLGSGVYVKNPRKAFQFVRRGAGNGAEAAGVVGRVLAPQAAKGLAATGAVGTAYHLGKKKGEKSGEKTAGFLGKALTLGVGIPTMKSNVSKGVGRHRKAMMPKVGDLTGSAIMPLSNNTEKTAGILQPDLPRARDVIKGRGPAKRAERSALRDKLRSTHPEGKARIDGKPVSAAALKAHLEGRLGITKKQSAQLEAEQKKGPVTGYGNDWSKSAMHPGLKAGLIAAGVAVPATAGALMYKMGPGGRKHIASEVRDPRLYSNVRGALTLEDREKRVAAHKGLKKSDGSVLSAMKAGFLREKRSSAMDPYVDVTGKSAPEQFEKVAHQRFALIKEGQNRFPIDTYGDVLEADRWFNDHGESLHPEERRELCTKLASRADEIGCKVTDYVKKYAGVGYAPDGEVRVAVATRMQYFQDDSPERDMLNGLMNKYAHVSPDVFCEAVKQFDEATGLDYHWDEGVYDPWYTTYGFIKTAAWEFSTHGDRINEEQLKQVVNAGYPLIKEKFGDDMADGLKKSPVQIFNSLPLDTKRIIMRMANDPQPSPALSMS